MSLLDAFATVNRVTGDATRPTYDAIVEHVAENYLGKPKDAAAASLVENGHQLRRKAIRERLRFYRDDYESEAGSLIDLVFEDVKVKEQRKKFISMAMAMNVSKRVVNEVASLYDRPAVRSYKNRGETDGLRQVETDYNWHAIAKEASRLLFLCNEVLWWHVQSPVTGTRRLDLITPDTFDVIPDPRDPKVAAGYLIDAAPITVDSGSMRRGHVHWELWDNEVAIGIDGNLRMVGEPRPHGFGRLPGELVHRGVVHGCLLDAASGQDILSAHKAVLFLNVLMLRLSKSQGERQPVLQGLLSQVASGQSMDGETPIALPPEVTLDMLDSKTDPEHYLKVIKHYIGGVAQTYGMSYEQFTFQETADTTSGRAYQVRREKLTELRNEQAQTWRTAEPKIAHLIGLPVAGFSVDFREQGLPQDPIESRNLLREDMRLGLRTPMDFMMSQDPDLTPETAFLRLKSNLLKNSMIWDIMRTANMSATADAENPGQTPEENGADNDSDDEDSEESEVKLAIAIKVWKRHELARATILSLQEAARNSDFNVAIMVCGSEGETTRSLAESLQCAYVEAPNSPLTFKANANLAALEELSPDYVMVTGSDDVVSNFFEAYEKPMSLGYDVIGWGDCYLYDSMTKDLWYWLGYVPTMRDAPIGAGLALSRGVMDAIGWQHTDLERDVNLDSLLRHRVIEFCPNFTEWRMRFEDYPQVLIDVKGNINLTPLDRFKSRKLIKEPNEQQRKALQWLG